MPESTRLSAKDVVDSKTPHGLKALLTRLRDDPDTLGRVSFDTIADRIALYYGVRVTGEAVRQWCKDEGVA